MSKKRMIRWLVPFMLFCSCDERRLLPPLFPEYDENASITKKIFSVDSQDVYNNEIFYKFQLRSWRGIVDSANNFIPEFVYSGLLKRQDDKIYCLGDKNAPAAIFFDFEMQPGDSIRIQASLFLKKFLEASQEKISKRYTILMEDKIPLGQDTVYKFNFHGFGFKYTGDNLVFYVSKRTGVKLIYASLIFTGRECIFMRTGDTSFINKSFVSCDLNTL